MVVRINKLELSDLVVAAGWPSNEHTGTLRYQWPTETHLYEVTILEQDEAHRTLQETFRQQQLRKLIPAAVEAVREMSDHLIVRLDGQFARGELLSAVSRIVAGDELYRHAMSPVRRIDSQAVRAYGGVRAVMNVRELAGLCADESLGLQRTVRLRVFAVPEEMVEPLLDIDRVDDDRWEVALTSVGFVLATTPGLNSLQIFTSRLDTSSIKSRLTQRLKRPASRPLNA